MSAAPHWVESWEMGLVSRLGLRPVAAGLLVAGSFMGVYVVVESLFGPLLEEPFSPQVFGFAVAAVLAGYAVGAGHAIGTAQTALLDELEPVMEVPRSDGGALHVGRYCGAGAIVLAAGFMFLVDTAVRELVTLGRVTSDALLSALFVPITFYLTVRATFFTLAFLYELAASARRSLSVELLEPERLAPLGRAGLQGALLFIGMAALASLSVIGTGGTVIESVLVCGLLCAAVAAFLYPVRGCGSRIRKAKQRALADVRREIRSDRERMSDDPAAAARLPALLAYEARIEHVSEWPFDSATLTRFVLLLLVPLLSWLGGALVERALDLVW